jgi:hypothetical protein
MCKNFLDLLNGLLLPDVCLSQAFEDFRLSLLEPAGFAVLFVNYCDFLTNSFILLFLGFNPFLNSDFFGVDPNSVVDHADLLTARLKLLHLFLLHLCVLF